MQQMNPEASGTILPGSVKWSEVRRSMQDHLKISSDPTRLCFALDDGEEVSGSVKSDDQQYVSFSTMYEQVIAETAFGIRIANLWSELQSIYGVREEPFGELELPVEQSHPTQQE